MARLAAFDGIVADDRRVASADPFPVTASAPEDEVAVPPTMPALRISGITKRFPARRLFKAPPRPVVLSDVTLSIDFGEIVGIMGSNGAGKTTLLEIIATLIEPSGGSIEICGRDVTRRPAELRAILGYAGAAGHGFYSRMSAGWNLEFFAVLNNIPRAEARRRATELLATVELAHASSAKVETFSEGMRQRLALASALVADPAILLLDEPTRSVDPAFRQTVHGLLQRWCREKSRRAVVIVTHSFDEAEALCHRVCVLDRGRLVWEGSPRGARRIVAP
jgi:ABC-2 type transport system ATP-binding protein